MAAPTRASRGARRRSATRVTFPERGVRRRARSRQLSSTCRLVDVPSSRVEHAQLALDIHGLVQWWRSAAPPCAQRGVLARRRRHHRRVEPHCRRASPARKGFEAREVAVEEENAWCSAR
jgi:hypothetical protein